jgi:hypothetical protein
MKQLLIPIFLIIGLVSNAQSFQIGGLEDQALRQMQLQGKLSIDYSFTSRPYTSGDSITYQSINAWINGNEITKSSQKKPSFEYEILPITWKQQFNSHHPFGWNDGGMIPAKGYQTMISAGIYAKAGPLSIQLQPEFIYAANPNFETSPLFGAPTNGAYKKLFPGQSSIRLNLKNVSFGLSSESLWWGPGTNSSLLMSNNAPGFLHLSFNSLRPIKTPIGSFEWQLVGGRLEFDSSLSSQVTNLKPATEVVYPQSKDWRYLNGLSITWQPKWMKGIFFGVNRVFQVYNEDLKLPPSSFINDYIPVFTTLFKQKITSTEDAKNRDQEISLFSRWVFQKAHAEIYVEYGWNDHSYDLRDFAMAPTHSAAYLFGFKKLMPLNNNRKILVETEITQMQESVDGIVRPAGNWYEHGVIKPGYTHDNQIMGAGSGFGNNVQMLSIKDINGWKQWGFQLERIQNDPNISSTKWTDLLFGLNGQIRKENWIFNWNTSFIFSNNYAWVYQKQAFNFYASLSVQYRLNHF